jgi:hypothetical protein
MTTKRSFRQVVVALFLLAAFLFQGTWALAGVTGGLGGYVTDEQGKAIAAASVKVLSASQAASGTTDASGHFTFLALAPDTYTVSIQKEGFAPLSVAGVAVFADNQLALTFQLQKQLKTIANVTSTVSGSLVKSGVGSDIYNVNSATISAAQSLGGGGNLNSAYSAMAAVPGVNVTVGTRGWNQPVYIRGQQSYFSGFEYDGVPVNRAFDNYNASTESNLGLQELQVYTGGGPASNASSGSSGFINQVIKTGTFPGYASLGGGIGTDAFYHQAKVEAGGASPDRNFSYYVGLAGYNQAFRFIDNQNGTSLMGPGGIYSSYSYANAHLPIATASGAWSQCSTATGATPASVMNLFAPVATGGEGLVIPAYGPAGPPGFCISPYAGYSGLTSFIQDRENVINFHFAIPRKDGQRDDIQLLWSASMLKTFFYGDMNDLNGPNAFMLAANGKPYVPPNAANNNCSPFKAGSNCPGFLGGYVFDAPFGTPAASLVPSAYQFPDSPADLPLNAQLPYGTQDNEYNDQGIVKLQYTHAIGDRAYARVMGYTFFSDWNQTAPYSAYASEFGNPGFALSQNYLLITHTYGGQFQFSDQINDKNLLQLTVNNVQANVLRDNNTTATTAAGSSASPFGIVSYNSTTGFTCYASAQNGGAVIPCYSAPNQCLLGASTTTSCTAGHVVAGAAFPTISPADAAAGAQLEYLWSGPEIASYNTVRPNFTNVSLSDQWRPSDRWLVNGALRFENYTYNLANTNNMANAFYAQIAANNFCYATPGATINGVVQTPGTYSLPLSPGQSPPASPIEIPVTTDCNAYIAGKIGSGATAVGFVHPNGTVQDGVQAPAFTGVSPDSYNLNYWSARYSLTYTESPDTVWRFSGGRFIEPPISASIQYNNASGNNLAQWANFMDLGFFSPFHNTPSQTSAQYDLSLERHIRGTDMSFKVTPFYNLTNGYQVQSYIGPGYVTQVPVGQFKSLGVEGAFTKGDFSKNGLSGTIAITYTDAKVQYQAGLVNNLGANQIGYYNTAIGNYNSLAKGGSQNYPCFNFANLPASGNPGAGVGTPGVAQACTGTTAANPYFNSPQQAMLDPNGWYAPAGLVALPGVNYSLGLYDAPWVSSLILNYRHDKFAITPSLQVATGSSYGSPFTVEGVDPRLCTQVDPNQSGNQCAYTSLIGQGATPTGLLFVPNPFTGTFDSIGVYRNPNILVGNLAISYDISPKLSVNVTAANLFHTCFGGSSEPWTTANPPGQSVCGYTRNSAFVSNYQLGPGYLTPGQPSTYSAAANGTSLYSWQQYPYAPTNGSNAGIIPPPFNIYITFNVKL